MAEAKNGPQDDLKVREASDADLITEPLAKMKPIIHRFLAVWLIGLAVLSLTTIYSYWPTEKGEPSFSTQGADAMKDSSATRLAMAKNGDPEDGRRYILIALLFGILGGCAHGLASLMDFRGQRRLFQSWTLWYFGLPIVGGMMAVIFYVVVRAGFFAGDASARDINIYGVAAFSAMTGLFTDAATDKLSEVFKTLFAPADKNKKPKEGQLTGEL